MIHSVVDILGVELGDSTSTVFVTQNGVVELTPALIDGSVYSVEVQAQPTEPAQTCTVTKGVGRISGSEATVLVTCATTP